MKLDEAFAKINKYEFYYINEEDIKYYMCCIYDSKPIIYNGIKFFIDPKSLKDLFIIQSLYVDMCKDKHSWRYKEFKNAESLGRLTFGAIISEIEVDLYRLQKISRI